MFGQLALFVMMLVKAVLSKTNQMTKQALALANVNLDEEDENKKEEIFKKNYEAAVNISISIQGILK